MKRENKHPREVVIPSFLMPNELRGKNYRLKVGMGFSLLIHILLLTCIKLDLQSSPLVSQSKSIQIVVDKATHPSPPFPPKKATALDSLAPHQTRKMLRSAKVPRKPLPRQELQSLRSSPQRPTLAIPDIAQQQAVLPSPKPEKQMAMIPPTSFREAIGENILAVEREEVKSQAVREVEKTENRSARSTPSKVESISPEREQTPIDPNLTEELSRPPILQAEGSRQGISASLIRPFRPGLPHLRGALNSRREPSKGEMETRGIEITLRPEDIPFSVEKSRGLSPIKGNLPYTHPVGEIEVPLPLSAIPKEVGGQRDGPGLSRRLGDEGAGPAFPQGKGPSLNSEGWGKITSGRREGGTEGLWEQIGQIISGSGREVRSGTTGTGYGKFRPMQGLQGISRQVGEGEAALERIAFRAGGERNGGGGGMGRKGVDQATERKGDQLRGRGGTPAGFKGSVGAGRIGGVREGGLIDSLKAGWQGILRKGGNLGTGYGFGKIRPNGEGSVGEGKTGGLPGWGNEAKVMGPSGNGGPGDRGRSGIRLARQGFKGPWGPNPEGGPGIQSGTGFGREGTGGMEGVGTGTMDWGSGRGIGTERGFGGPGHGKWRPGQGNGGAAGGKAVTGIGNAPIARGLDIGWGRGSGPIGTGANLALQGSGGGGRRKGPGIGEGGTVEGRTGQGVGYSLVDGGGTVGRGGSNSSKGIRSEGSSKVRPGGLIARAIGTFRMPTVRLSDWDDPGLIPNLLSEVSKRTQIKVSQASKYEELKLANIENTPLVYFTGHKSFKLSDDQRQILRQYTQLGGTLMFENDHGPFAGSVMREMRKIYGEAPKPIPLSDPIFQEMQYRIKEVPGGDLRERKPLLGIKKDGRWVVIFSRNDYGDVYANRVPFIPESERERVREEALQMGINIYQYATAHWNAIQEERQASKVADSHPSETPQSGPNQEQRVPQQASPAGGGERENFPENLSSESS